MDNTESFLIEKLTVLKPNDENEFDEPALSSIAEEMAQCSNPDIFFEHIFSKFEAFPTSFFGQPGPLIHFLEKHYPHYVNLLIESATRKPSLPTVWMINRILNGNLDNKTRTKLLDLLTSISMNKKIDKEIMNSAMGFLDFQNENAS